MGKVRKEREGYYKKKTEATHSKGMQRWKRALLRGFCVTRVHLFSVWSSWTREGRGASSFRARRSASLTKLTTVHRNKHGHTRNEPEGTSLLYTYTHTRTHTRTHTHTHTHTHTCTHTHTQTVVACQRVLQTTCLGVLSQSPKGTSSWWYPALTPEQTGLLIPASNQDKGLVFPFSSSSHRHGAFRGRPRQCRLRRKTLSQM